MLEIITNPITISVVVMCVLCLIKINVILSVVAATLVAGLFAKMPIADIMSALNSGMSDNGEMALGYLLLGIFAAALAYTGLADILSKKLSVILRGNKKAVLATLVISAVISGTLIPVHIAFIPILIPPMLSLMNEMKLDRRAAASALSFGLLAPYITIPIGYGIIFQDIVANSMTTNGMPFTSREVIKFNWILGLGLLIGLIISLVIFNKDREYKDIKIENKNVEEGPVKIEYQHIISIIAIFVTVIAQLAFKSLPLGAILGLAVMIAGGAIKLNDVEEVVNDGIGIMGMISFVMFVSGGYTSVIKATGAVDSLVKESMNVLGDSKPIFLGVLIVIGLIIVTGLGTSFGTVPILAVIYVPMCLQMGMSAGATCCLISCAATLGDAGSPASDTTLGPTAGLNADGQHDHIWDTCVPTFISYNVPLALAGFIGAMIF